jgi:hypothetical protein
VEQHWPGKCKALSSVPRTEGKKRKKKKLLDTDMELFPKYIKRYETVCCSFIDLNTHTHTLTCM